MKRMSRRAAAAFAAGAAIAGLALGAGSAQADPEQGHGWCPGQALLCSPRGALIIIPPICDEIGVDWPPGSLQN